MAELCTGPQGGHLVGENYRVNKPERVPSLPSACELLPMQ